MKYKVLKDIRNLYKKDDVLNLTQGELDYGLRIGVDGLCPIVELIEGGYIEELVEEKKEPKFIEGEAVRVGNFFTRIKGVWAEEDGTFKYYIKTNNPERRVFQQHEIDKPTDYELGTYY